MPQLQLGPHDEGLAGRSAAETELPVALAENERLREELQAARAESVRLRSQLAAVKAASAESSSEAARLRDELNAMGDAVEALQAVRIGALGRTSA
jgi:chromosome segregation ATPase